MDFNCNDFGFIFNIGVPYPGIVRHQSSAPRKVYRKCHVKASKYEDDVEEVELLNANPNYAHVKMCNGKEDTVSLQHLAPKNGADNDLVINEDEVVPNLPYVTDADEHSKYGNDLVNNPNKLIF